jgi:glucokinase
MSRGPLFHGAIDLGGTKILSLMADADGQVYGEDRRASHTSDGLEAVLQRMVESLDAALDAAGRSRADLTTVGVASPGTVDTLRGVVAGAGQLPGWRDVPLRDLMEERLGLPVALENDATAAALGEHAFGAGRGARHMLYITVSTGIGGGIIIDGRLYGGASGAAGELGHIVIDPQGPPCTGCGSHGCLEILASGTAIARRAQELLARGQAPILARLAQGQGRVTAEMVEQAALAGDEACQQTYAEAGHYLGIALASYVNIFNPEVITIGGGVVKAGDLLLEPARHTMQGWAMPQPLRDVRLAPSPLDKRAGALGMVAILRQLKQGKPA